MDFELSFSLASLGQPVPHYLVTEAFVGSESQVTEQAQEILEDLEDRGTSRILAELLKIC